MSTDLAEPETSPENSPDQAAQATQSSQADEAGRARQAGQGGLIKAWRKLRVPLGLIALVLVGGILIALLAPRPKSNTYLDPGSSDLDGVKALTDILSNRGFHVISTYSPQSALSAIGPAHAGPPAATLVITSPGLLTAGQRAQLAHADADLLLVEPLSAALSALAPAIRLANGNAPVNGPVDPACGIAAARLAGTADLGGVTYKIPGYATGCYPEDGQPSLVRYSRGDTAITVLGNGLLLSNGALQSQGNAALALNLLDGPRTIVWLTPEPTVAPATAPPPARHNGPALIPATAWLVVLQLCVALAFAALWRMRRFGPLITEQLPVVVRASETVEGHARLYQSRRARDRAAGALRTAVLGRIRPALGLTADAPIEAVVAGLSGRSRRSAHEIEAVLTGPPPGTDADLVGLASELDELEREVRSQ